MVKVFLSFIFFLFTGMFHPKGKSIDIVRYMALGDSYTIGTGADPNEAWPVLLTKQLNDAGIKTSLVANPSRNGYTTQNLIDIELPVFDKADVNFVSLLIGVNDWVRGIDSKTFHTNLNYIIDHVQKKLLLKKNILLVTIPNFGITSQGSLYGHGRDITKGIEEFNDLIKAEAKKRGLNCVDIFDLSLSMKTDTSLVASDELHPSAKEYAIWTSLIFPSAKQLLGNIK
jgi:acyl-CoA thioesterase-1